MFLNPEKEEAILDEKALQLGGVLKALRFLKLGEAREKASSTVVLGVGRWRKQTKTLQTCS
ncbi:hypothetical protein BWK47_05530 [Synechocystis sp. CACIAM 05]|nr:hypothetical protein BWK47_05530 [Synechocystis sp. CACIAM 05]